MSVSVQTASEEGTIRTRPRMATSMLARNAFAVGDGTAGTWVESPHEFERPGNSNSAEAGRLGRIGTIVSFSGGSQLYGEAEPAEYLYRLITGVARGYRMTRDGRRQVVAFYMPGDLFGFELGGEHTFSVEAVSNTKARMIKRTIVSAVSVRDPHLAEELVSSIARELRRNQQHVRRLSKTAPERVASFVLELADRLSKEGIVNVPMSRRDIADYLGVTIETVSRTLTQLTKMTVIAMSGPRKIAIRNPGLLRRFASDVPV